MKRIFAMFLTMLMMFSFVGCKKDATPPKYESGEKFDIGMWVGISDKLVIYNDDGSKESYRYLTDDEFLEKYQEIADAGITIAFPGYDVMIDGGAYNLKALQAAHTVGIKHILGDNTLRTTLLQAKSLVDAGIKTEDQIVQDIKDIIQPYTSSPYASALYGFMVQDEPGASKFDALGYAEKLFKQAAPDLMFYVNLFPVIAGGAQLSGAEQAITYDAYLSQYFAKIGTDYVSYDHYPLYSNGIETSLEASFLYNMDVVRSKIDEEGKNRRFWTFLQSIQYGARNRELLSKADATFQAYSFMAYGGTGIQWFCYACPPQNDGATYFANNAPINRDYEKTAAYDYIQGANRDIQALMPYYKNFSWKAVMLSSVYDDSDNFSYLDSSQNVVTSTKSLKGISSTEDAFAGVFEDKDGNEGFMVVNFTDPERKLGNKVTLSVKDGYSHILVVNAGEEKVYKVKKGSVSFDMAPGDGYFVIPFGKK